MLNRGLTDTVGRGEHARAMKYREALDSLPQIGLGLSVHDDGDRISLDSSLGQRLSKVVKQVGKGTAGDIDIATRIFETVDGKAAEPKTSPDTGKGAPRGRHLFARSPILTPEERRILESPHEILLVHTAEGRLKSVTLGGPRNVSIPDVIPKGTILSHNHPSGRGPSDSDLKSVLSFPGMTLRVVCRNEHGKSEVFSMKFTGRLSKHEIQAYADLYFKQCDEAGDTHIARRESLALISQIIGDMFEAVTRTFQ